MNDALQTYTDRIDDFTRKKEAVSRRISRMGNLRLVSFVAALAAPFFLYRLAMPIWAIVGFFIGIFIFVLFVFRNHELIACREKLDKYIRINNDGLARLKNTWQNYSDRGEEYIDTNHPFTNDLDIFGSESAFQWIGSVHSFYGRRALARLLGSHPGSIEQINQRREAVAELASQIDWRQTCEALALSPALAKEPQRVIQWAEENTYVLINRVINKIVRLLPFVSLIAAASLVFYYESLAAAGTIYLVHFLLAMIMNRFISPVLEKFEENGGAFQPFSKLIGATESQTFKSPLLRKLTGIFGSKGKTSGPVKDLASIVSSIQVRHSPMGHFFANIIWLWDLQNVIRAEDWKRKHGGKLREWLETEGEIEALAALSVIHFEHPSWTFAKVRKGRPFIEAQNLGHPLLADDTRVTNDFSLDSENRVAIITGSNMSGKSTFLRTVGINLVLAYAGAPVCADTMRCSLINTYTSMRIGDNLRNNVSTFYAELLRIKQIVEAAKRQEHVLFLLDELFRGTNSQDRHDGAVAVVKALKTEQTLGIISTHDLKLSELAEGNDSGFCNCHFKEYYKDREIHFDYKLYPGPSTTRNAMFLIKAIGIPVLETN